MVTHMNTKFMNNRCKICKHPKKKKIEKDILQGITYSVLVKKYNLISPGTITTHRHEHMKEIYKELVNLTTLQEAIEMAIILKVRTQMFLRDIQQDEDFRILVEGLTEVQKSTEALAKLLKEKDKRKNKQ